MFIGKGTLVRNRKKGKHGKTPLHSSNENQAVSCFNLYSGFNEALYKHILTAYITKKAPLLIKRAVLHYCDFYLWNGTFL